MPDTAQQHFDNNSPWDAVIIGAGPAGSVSAALLAARGWRVLLVERKAWPRDKACGGCLNAAGVRMLHERGLGDVLLDATPLHDMHIHRAQRTLHIPTPAGAAVERREFDRRLVQHAVNRGATFLPETIARVLPDADSPFRHLTLQNRTNHNEIRTRLVLACDGLAGDSLHAEPWARTHARTPIRIGFATTLPANDLCPPGTIKMCVADTNYVGLVRLPNGDIHIGASLNAAICRAARGPRTLVQRALDSSGFHGLNITTAAHWIGTPPLSATRHRVAGQRVVVIGDACGYIEPFTGEGISWAIRGACAATDLLPTQPSHWHDNLINQWQAIHRRQIVARQAWCKAFRYLLERPTLSAACLHAARSLPWLPALVARKISA